MAAGPAVVGDVVASSVPGSHIMPEGCANTVIRWADTRRTTTDPLLLVRVKPVNMAGEMIVRKPRQGSVSGRRRMLDMKDIQEHGVWITVVLNESGICPPAATVDRMLERFALTFAHIKPGVGDLPECKCGGRCMN